MKAVGGKQVFATCQRKEGELITKGGQAYTPAQMYQMAKQGIPVSSANCPTMQDGEPNPSWDITLERIRGVDPADLWQAQQDIRRKVKSAHRNDVAKYGK